MDIKYVNKLENYRHTARFETLEQILEALGVIYSEFFNFDIKADGALVEKLLVILSKIPEDKQEKKIKALIALIEEYNEPETKVILRLLLDGTKRLIRCCKFLC